MHLAHHTPAVAAALLLAAAPHAAASIEVWTNPWTHNNTVGPSIAVGSTYAEVADDFEVTASIDRIIVRGFGNGCFICPPQVPTGVFVRFYEWTAAGPGELQLESFVPADDPNFQFNATTLNDISVRLPHSFAASGRHFVSVQVALVDNPDILPSWNYWQSRLGNPTLSRAHTRSSPAGDWQPVGVNTDIAFQLFGTLPGGPPVSEDPCGQWEILPSPNPADSVRTQLSDIAAISASDIWAVGSYGSYFSQWLIRSTYILHWNGESWSHIPSPTPADCPSCANAGLTSVATVSPSEVWAAGNAARQNGHLGYGNHIYVIRWNGSQWQEVPTPDIGPGVGDSIADIEVVSPDHIWFVGAKPPPGNAPRPALALRWNGSGFDEIPVPIVNFELGRNGGNPLNAISALGPNDAWAVGGSSVSAAGNYSQIHHWDGAQWTHVPGPTPGFYNQLFAVEAIAPNDVWASGEVWEATGNIRGFLIHWDGTSWAEVPAPNIFFDLHAFGPNNIYGVSGGVYHFDGSDWTRVEDFPQAPYATMTSIDATGPCELWAAGQQLGFTYETLTARLNPSGTTCTADRNRDGEVNSADISEFLTSWLASVQGGTFEADFNNDQQVNSGDISAFLSAWLDAVQNGC